MREINFKSQNCVTTFIKSGKSIRLKELLGLYCGFCGRDEGPQDARGLMLIRTNRGRFEGDDLILKESSFTEDNVRLVWETREESLQIESRWTFCPKTGVWSRKERLYNNGKKGSTILQVFSRFVFSPGRYKIYSQSSKWCHESQGKWETLEHGRVLLRCEGGRTCQGGTPYVCLHEVNHKDGIAFHILPRGNWTVRITARTFTNDSLPLIVVELGLADENLNFNLSPGSSFDLPEIIFQPLPEAKPFNGAPQLHRYLLDNHFKTAKKEAPVVYNTWLDVFEDLRVERLRRQLKAAKKIGCEVFVVDAGWYGNIAGNWFTQAGDWREKEEGAFYGKMADFAEEVRASGMGFGLWMEPERITGRAPIINKHPEWFISAKNGNFYPDLSKGEVYKYLKSEISRLLETYKLAWLKIDFNFELGVDPSGREFSLYYEAWYRMLDELRQKYPGVFFEGCASGGMRLDLSTLSHFDGHFLSDTANPIDIIRIYQNSILRIPPGRITKWVCLRPIGVMPESGIPLDSTSLTLISPAGPTWEPSVTTKADFAIRAALPGMLGLSGDIGALPDESLDRLRFHIEFYKKWRSFMAESIAYLLTPPSSKADRTGWVGIQLYNQARKKSLVFIYRLEDRCDKNRFSLYEVDPDKKYSIVNIDDGSKEMVPGEVLINNGLEVELPGRNRAGIFIVS